MPEPRHQEEYEGRQTTAARRVLIDLGQVLAAFRTQMVIVGGWVPELGFETQGEAPHVGSIDVDVALDIQKLSENAYAEMIDLLLNTGRYRQGGRPFQLIATVDLKDGMRRLRSRSIFSRLLATSENTSQNWSRTFVCYNSRPVKSLSWLRGTSPSLGP